MGAALTGRVEIIDHPSGNRTVLVRRGTLSPPAPARRTGETAWYIPYTAVHALTVAAAPTDAVWIDVSTHPDAYHAALESVWARGETFAVLEHDVVCRPEIVGEFEECPEPWCLYGYSDWCHEACREGWRNALGCTRFRAELVREVPDALSSIPPGERGWTNVCDGLGNNLRAAKFEHHWHGPPIEHHRETHRL